MFETMVPSAKGADVTLQRPSSGRRAGCSRSKTLSVAVGGDQVHRPDVALPGCARRAQPCCAPGR